MMTKSKTSGLFLLFLLLVGTSSLLGQAANLTGYWHNFNNNSSVIRLSDVPTNYNIEAVAFGIATGRVLDRTMTVLERWNVPRPDVLITAVGSEIYYGRPDLIVDLNWNRTIDYRWDPDGIRRCLSEVPGIRLQPERDQRAFKLSYFVDRFEWPGPREVRRRLKEHGISASLIYSHHEFLDLLPARASKGRAIQYLASDLAAVATFDVSNGLRVVANFTEDRALLAHAVDTLGVPQLSRIRDPLNLT